MNINNFTIHKNNSIVTRSIIAPDYIASICGGGKKILFKSQCVISTKCSNLLNDRVREVRSTTLVFRMM